MGQLGDVLEVLFGPDDRFRTIRATIRWWFNRDLASRMDGQERMALGRRKANSGREPRPSTVEGNLSIWLSGPACARIEERREVDGVIETKLTVTDGDHLWECDSEGHVETSERECRGRRGSGLDFINSHVNSHFNPAQIRCCFQDLTFESLGLIRTAGRNCLRLRAVPRPGARLWPHWLSPGADDYEFHVDRERGVLLNILGRYADEVFSVDKVLEVAFDEPLKSDLFTYEPAPGEQVESKVRFVEHLTLTGAVARMPFTVLIPTRVPDPEHSELEVLYHPPRRRGGWSHLSLIYRGSDVYDHLWVEQGATPYPGLDHFEWERIVVEGGIPNDLRISDPGTTPGKRVVAFEKQGTHVWIKSDLDRARLIDLAMSFAAASNGN